MRYNLLLGEFDDQQLALRVRLTPRQWLTPGARLTWRRRSTAIRSGTSSRPAPTAICARRYEIALRARREGLRARVRALLRRATPGETVRGQDVGAQAPGGRFAGGGTWARRRGARARSCAPTATATTATAAARLASTRRPRATRSDPGVRARGAADRLRLAIGSAAARRTRGVVFGAQAGGRYQLAPGVRAAPAGRGQRRHLLPSQFRGLARHGAWTPRYEAR